MDEAENTNHPGLSRSDAREVGRRAGHGTAGAGLDLRPALTPFGTQLVRNLRSDGSGGTTPHASEDDKSSRLSQSSTAS